MSLQTFFTKQYVTKDGAEKLRNYKYSGSDNSLIYTHILSPFAGYCVNNFIPSWVAPNLLTVTGLCFALASHLVIYYMFPDQIEGEYAVWVPCFCAIMGFIYMNFDNMDGKQARKTGNSTPLGLLFDHGVDSLMTFVVGINIFTIAQCKNGPIAALGYFVAGFNFFFPTMEEYYLHTLDLPIINGATEGQLILQALFYFSAVQGAGWWQQETFGLQRTWFLLFILIAATIPLFVNTMYKLYRKVPEKFFEACSNLLTPLVVLGTMVVIACFSPTNVMERKARFVIYVAGFSFAKLMTRMQLAHISGQQFNQFCFSIWTPQLMLIANTMVGYCTGRPMINEDLLINALLFYVVFAYLHFILNVIDQITTVLGIRTFKIKSKTA